MSNICHWCDETYGMADISTSVSHNVEECRAILRAKRDAMVLQISELQNILHDLAEWGGNDWHKNSCPEDDTCDCPKAKRVNAAMKGYAEKRKDEDREYWCSGCGAILEPKDGGGSVRSCGNCA